MKKNLWAWAPVCLVLLAACNGDGKKTGKDSATAPVATATVDTTGDDARISTETYVAEIISKRQEIEKQLPGSTPDKAVALYRSLALCADTALLAISANEGAWLDKYVNYYSEKEGAYVPPADVKERIRLLATAGIEPWNIGEGYTELRLVPNFFTGLFKSSLPPDYNTFLDIRAAEDTVLYSADAGLMISFNQVGKRVLSWEKFLDTYPGSVFAPVAREYYERYFYDYLFGEDNTPSFEKRGDASSLDPANKKEYLDFIQQHGDTKAGKIVKLFLERIAAGVSYVQLSNDLQDAIAQAFADKIALMPVQTDFGVSQIERLTKPVYDTVPGEIEISEGNTDEIERSLDTIMYVQQDNIPYCLAVYTNRGKGGGAPVSGWVDVWLFKKTEDRWQTASFLLNAGGGGMYGNSGYFNKLVRMGNNTIGIVVTGGITHMGSDVSWDDVIAWTGNKLEHQFNIVTQNMYNNGSGTQSCVINRWMFQQGRQEYYDLLIFPASCLVNTLPLDKVTIPYRNGHYTIPDSFQDRGI